jgi:Lon protease-like protein
VSSYEWLAGARLHSEIFEDRWPDLMNSAMHFWIVRLGAGSFLES